MNRRKKTNKGWPRYSSKIQTPFPRKANTWIKARRCQLYQRLIANIIGSISFDGAIYLMITSIKEPKLQKGNFLVFTMNYSGIVSFFFFFLQKAYFQLGMCTMCDNENCKMKIHSNSIFFLVAMIGLTLYDLQSSILLIWFIIYRI